MVTRVVITIKGVIIRVIIIRPRDFRKQSIKPFSSLWFATNSRQQFNGGTIFQ
jgi:hypothetical protein